MKNECPSTDGDDFTSRTDLDMNTHQQLEQFAHSIEIKTLLIEGL